MILDTLADSSAVPFVSVVVVTYNGKRFLNACLNSLQGQDYPQDRMEVILVDNGSSDDSVVWVKKNFPLVQVVEAGKNLGFAGGNNLGIRAACGEIFALLNNDTEVPSDWISSLVKTSGLKPAVGIVASKILFQHDHEMINSAGLVLLPDGRGKDRGFREKDLGQFEKTEEVFGACGAGMLLRKKMLDQIGFFDERLFMYYEDLDLCWRANRAGWKCLYSPSSRVFHIHCGSSGSWSPFFTFHVERNRALVSAKNAPMLQAIRSVFTVFAKAAIRIVQSLMLCAFKPGQFPNMVVYTRVAVSLTRHLPAVLAKRLFSSDQITERKPEEGFLVSSAKTKNAA